MAAERMSDVVLGLDLSLSGLGAVAVPLDWDLRPERVRGRTLGVSLPRDATPRAHTLRLMAIARDVVTLAVYYGATEVWAEDLPTRAAYGVVQLAELRGVVRVELERCCGLSIRFVQACEARRLLYGGQPPRGVTHRARKRWLLEPLKLCGLPLEDDAQGDAFAICNWALSEAGAPCLAGLCAPPRVSREAAE